MAECLPPSFVCSKALDCSHQKEIEMGTMVDAVQIDVGLKNLLSNLSLGS